MHGGGGGGGKAMGRRRMRGGVWRKYWKTWRIHMGVSNEEEMEVSGEEGEVFARFDVGRVVRTGVPEAVFCPSKTPEQIARIMCDAVGDGGAYAALATRMSEDVALCVQESVPEMIYHSQCGMGVLWREERSASSDAASSSSSSSSSSSAYVPCASLVPTEQRVHGRVAIVSAGTADQRIASEACCTAEVFGVEHVLQVCDVGVAGLHRLMRCIDSIRECDVVLVVAGMDGCLPSVVAGLVDAPVIAVPTSVGYGVGGNGIAALLTSLSSCAPGVSVVNVDNGFGAATVAIKILRRARTMAQRQTHASDH